MYIVVAAVAEVVNKVVMVMVVQVATLVSL